MHTGERYREKEGQAEARGWPNIFFSHSARQTERQTSLMLFNTFKSISYQLINLCVSLRLCALFACLNLGTLHYSHMYSLLVHIIPQ